MKPSTNTLLTALLLVALVITSISTILNVARFVEVRDGLGLLTGAATTTGTGVSNLTISSSTSITNNVAAIQFGSGFVNSSCTSCVMDSDGKHNQTAFCCLSFDNVSSGFLLENTGNINLSVNYTCAGSCIASTFIGGTSPAFEMRATANSVAGQSGETSTADTEASCNEIRFGGWNFSNTTETNNEAVYQPVIATGGWLCGNETNYPLDFTDARDAGVVDINVSIPVDAATGSVQTATFTFTATSSA